MRRLRALLRDFEVIEVRVNNGQPIATCGSAPAAGDFAMGANLRGKWSGAGNRGGLLWDYRDARNYSAVLLSPATAERPGTVEVIEVVAGVRRVMASGRGELPTLFFGRANVSRIDGELSVSATGMTAPIRVRQQARGGDVGFIASWNLVRFDLLAFAAQNGPN